MGRGEKKKLAEQLQNHVSGQSNKPLTKPAHSLSYEEVVEQLKVDSEDGLTHEEADRRHKEFGNNVLGDAKGAQPMKILVAQFTNAMMIVSVEKQIELFCGLLVPPECKLQTPAQTPWSQTLQRRWGVFCGALWVSAPGAQAMVPVMLVLLLIV